MTLADIARRQGCVTRTGQAAVAAGLLSPHRPVGRALVVYELAAQARQRSVARGRPWKPAPRNTTLDLLTSGFTAEVRGSEKSRLEARLRRMTVREIAHASGGVGQRVRYRSNVPLDIDPIGPSRVDMAQLGVVGSGGWLSFGGEAVLDAFEFDADVRGRERQPRFGRAPGS